MTLSNPSTPGLLGFLLDTTLSGPDIQVMDTCEMAAQVRKHIWCKLRDLQLNTDTPVEIDGEVWAPDRVITALLKLYDWTHKACADSQGAYAVVSTHTRCGKSDPGSTSCF